MRLTKDQHRRGWLRWTTRRGEVTTSTATVESEDELEVWSDENTNASGSVVASPNRQLGRLRVRLVSNVVEGLRILWERWTDQGVATTVYDYDLGPNPVQIQHVTNYGFAHRLVVSTPALAWEEDCTLRVGDMLIRFFVGTVNVERAHAEDRGKVNPDGTFSFEYESGTFVVEGRLIEIIANDDSAQEAELRAYGLLGLLALLLGENAVGEVESSEPYHVKSALEQFGATRALFAARMPRMASTKELETVDGVLPSLLQNDDVTRSMMLALRWYEKGVRSELAVDSLLAHLIGIEALVSAYSSAYGPIPQAVARSEKWRGILDGLKGKVGKADRSDALTRFSEPTLPERLRFYVEQRKLNAALERDFKFARQARNDVVHGRPRAITFADADNAEKVLRAILRTELGVTSELPADSHPRIREAVIDWIFDRSGQQQRARQASGPRG